MPLVWGMPRKTAFRLIFLILGLQTVAPCCRAEVWFLPHLEAPQELWISNPSSHDQWAWTAPPHDDGNTNTEKSWSIPAGSKIQIPLKDLPSDPWFQVMARTNLKMAIKQNDLWTSVPEGRSAIRALRNPHPAEALFVTNISPIRQDGMILFQSRKGEQLTQNLSLDGFSQTKISLPETEISSIQVKGQWTLLAHTWSSSGLQILIPEPEDVAKSNSVRFLASDTNPNSSFVVEISDPDLISQARAQIVNPNSKSAKIMIAQIAPGSGNINQNLNSRLHGSWSWHVSKVTKFADLALQSCDGTPEFVEEYLSSWLAASPTICFWSFRITKELPYPPTSELAP